MLIGILKPLSPIKNTSMTCFDMVDMVPFPQFAVLPVINVLHFVYDRKTKQNWGLIDSFKMYTDIFSAAV